MCIMCKRKQRWSSFITAIDCSRVAVSRVVGSYCYRCEDVDCFHQDFHVFTLSLCSRAFVYEAESCGFHVLCFTVKATLRNIPGYILLLNNCLETQWKSCCLISRVVSVWWHVLRFGNEIKNNKQKLNQKRWWSMMKYSLTTFLLSRMYCFVFFSK